MPERVRRYDANHFHDMLHELNLMKGRGQIILRPGINDTQFEEMVKKIDKHFSDNGMDIDHPMIRGMVVSNGDSYKNLKDFFVNIYAASNSIANARNRARHNVTVRVRARAARAARESAAVRRQVPLAAANEGRSWTRERSARSTIRNRGTSVARAAANAARARNASRRSRSTSRSRRSTGTRV